MIEKIIDNLKYTNDLIPVITQDQKGEVLMLAYVNHEAVKRSMETKKAWYWSRSRQKLWMKGEVSENTQEIIGIFTDCDRDSLLYVVKQKGNACHKNNYSCFSEPIYGDKPKSILEEVYSVIELRKKIRPEGSYVSNIIDDDERLIDKIREESEEVIEAFEEKDDNELIWEVADLMFHSLLLLANKNIDIDLLNAEFRKRRR